MVILGLGQGGLGTGGIGGDGGACDWQWSFPSSKDKHILASRTSVTSGARVRCTSRPEAFDMTVTLLHRGAVKDEQTSLTPATLSVQAARQPGAWQARLDVTGSINGKPISIHEVTDNRILS